VSDMNMDGFRSWYCLWCDSENKSEETEVMQGEAVCGACHCRKEYGGSAEE
jgi:hypothetical protein